MRNYNGIYIGKIEDNEDSENMGRCRIRVMGIHSQSDSKSTTDGIPDDELPWANQASGIFGGFSDDSNNSGISTVPSIGSWVYVFFLYGNPLYPIYFASKVSKNDFDTDSNYDNNTIINTKSGTKITINDNINDDTDNLGTEIKIETNKNTFTITDKDDEDKIEFNTNNGLKISLDNTENEQILIEDGINSNTITMNSDGILLEDSNGNTIDMNSSNVEINGKVTIST